MTDPLKARPPRPAPSGLLLKAAVFVLDITIGSLLWLVILAALPTTVGFAVTVVGIAVSALLAAGLGEGTAAPVLYRARHATPAEAPRLAVAWRIDTHGLDAGGVRLRIVAHGAPANTAGSRHVLRRRDVVAAYCANELNARQVAAVIAQGIGRLRHGHTRFDLLWTFWTVPWDVTRSITYEIGVQVWFGTGRSRLRGPLLDQARLPDSQTIMRERQVALYALVLMSPSHNSCPLGNEEGFHPRDIGRSRLRSVDLCDTCLDDSQSRCVRPEFKGWIPLPKFGMVH